MARQTAALILTNARVVTGNPNQPPANWIAVGEGKVLGVGDATDWEGLQNSASRIINCQGRSVVPGFNDAHLHVFSQVRRLFSVDLSPERVHSIKDLQAAIRGEAEKTPAGRWINGTNYSDFHLAEKRHPTRWELDDAAPNHPTVIAHRSLHACVLNSLGLELAGIGPASPEPEGGVIERDLASGEPNGILFEMLGYTRRKVIPPLTDEEVLRGLRQVNQEYVSQGITSIGEATVTNDLNQWRAFKRFRELGILKTRVNFLFGWEALKEIVEAGLRMGTGDQYLRLGGMKIILSEATGRLRPDQAELDSRVLEATGRGFQVAIHAIEKAMVEEAVQALERARGAFPLSNLRHRLEHCSQCPAELRERLKRVKAVVVSQPPFVYYSGDRYLATVPLNEQLWLYPFKSLMRTGVRVAASSDSPVVPANPLRGMYGAVTRLSESGQAVQPEEAVTPFEALRMYTHEAAYAAFEESVKGRLVPGQMADLAILSADPLMVTPEKLKDISVEMTIIGGQVVWEK